MQPYDHSKPPDANINKVTDEPTHAQILPQRYFINLLVIPIVHSTRIAKLPRYFIGLEKTYCHIALHEKKFSLRSVTRSLNHTFSLQDRSTNAGKHQSWAKHLSTTRVINMNPQNTLPIITYAPIRLFNVPTYCIYIYSKHLMRNNRENHMMSNLHKVHIYL